MPTKAGHPGSSRSDRSRRGRGYAERHARCQGRRSRQHRTRSESRRAPGTTSGNCGRESDAEGTQAADRAPAAIERYLRCCIAEALIEMDLTDAPSGWQHRGVVGIRRARFPTSSSGRSIRRSRPGETHGPSSRSPGRGEAGSEVARCTMSDGLWSRAGTATYIAEGSDRVRASPACSISTSGVVERTLTDIRTLPARSPGNMP